MEKLKIIVVVMFLLAIPMVSYAETALVLTVPEIIDVLVSLSDEQAWQVSGDCRPHIKFKPNEDKRLKGDRWVSIMNVFFLTGREAGYHYGSELVGGSVLKYSFIANSCPEGEHQHDYDCFGEEVHEVEVVSKTLVRIRQKTIRRDFNGFLSQGERSCIFQKK